MNTVTEHGFWDYTTPGAGGMEKFEHNDYLMLLDDMAETGMNSLAICVKWFTTGYRSQLDFLDQLPGSPVISSNNDLLRLVIEEAHKRKTRVWLNAVVSAFAVDRFGLSSSRTLEALSGHSLPCRVGFYDLDTPELFERAVAIFDELVDLFPEVDGLIIELENSGCEAPHRIELYNHWAEANSRPRFDKLGHPFHPRCFDVPDWRDYSIYQRLQLLKAIQAQVQVKGFTGRLAMLCETGRSAYVACQEVNTKVFHQQMPEWIGVTYEYEKWDMRYAMMDLAITVPKRDGLKVHYLPRGVMTWHDTWPMPIRLEQSWQMDLEDIQLFQPDGVWWFGCGTRSDGAHVNRSRLRQADFKNGNEARRALLRTISTWVKQK